MADIVDTLIVRLLVEGADKLSQTDAALAALDAAQGKAAASARALNAANDETVITEERVSRAKRTTTNELAKVIASVDKASAVTLRYAQDVQRINRVTEEQGASEKTRATLIALTTQRMEQQLAALENNTTATNENTASVQRSNTAYTTHDKALVASNENVKRATVSTGQLQFAVRNFGFQLNDVATGLLTGQSPFMIVAQQGGQVVQAFQQGGGPSAVLGGFASMLRGLISPTTLVVGGLAALAAGAVVLTSRAEATAQRLVNLNAIMSAFGTGTTTTAQGLDNIAKSLRDTGTEAAKAHEAIQALARIPGINAGAAATISPLARDIASVTGEDFIAVQTRMAKAFAESTDAAIKFVQSIAGPNGLTATEIANMQTMALHGDRAGALRVAMDALQRQFGGKFEEQMTASSKAITGIGAAWSNMLDKLSETRAVGAARDAIVGMLNAIAAAASGTASAVATIPEAPGPGEPRMPSIGTGGATIPGAGEALRRRQQLGLSPPDLSVGGALTSISRGANLVDLNTEVARRVEYWLTLLTAEEKSALSIGPAGAVRTFEQSVAAQQRGGIAATPGHSAHNLPYGIAVDIGGMSASAAAKLGLAGLHQPVPGDFPHVEPIETLSAATNTAAARERSFAAFGQRFGSGVFPNAMGAVVPLPPVQPIPELPGGLTEADKAAMAATLEFQAKMQAASKLTGESLTWWTTYLQQLGQGTKEEKDIWVAMSAANDAVARQRIENQKASDTQKIVNDLGEKTADAYGTDLVSGYQKAAQAEAELAVRNGQANDVASKTAEILRTQAVTAIAGAAQQEAAAKQQTTAQERLAVAAQKGLGPLHAQQVENEAIARTQDAYNKALATGDQALIARAKQVTETAVAEAKRLDILKTTTELATKEAQNQNTIQVLQLEASLAGQNTEEISRQVALLQAKQLLEERGVSLTSDIAQNYLKSVDALSRQVAATAEANRAAERMNSLVTSIGNTIDQNITSQLEKAFSGQKVDDWGKLLKNMLAQVQAQIISMTLIKPALGSVMSLLGFGGAAQGFGNLFGGSSLGGIGGLFGAGGGLGALFGSGGLTGSDNLVLKDDSGKTIGTLQNVGSLGNSLFGGGGGLFGGVSNWINSSIGTSLGFSAQSAASLFPGVAASELPAYVAANPSIFGTGMFAGSTLTGALGGIGPGMAAGSLINSLMGGNQLTGTVGSAVGSIAGSLIGTALLPGVGTILGGLLGGSGGGILGGLFGGKKKVGPSGGFINLETGEITGAFSGGVAAADQASRDVALSVQQMAKKISDATGALFPGNLGVRTSPTGTIEYSYQGQGGTAGDAASAINSIFKLLMQNVTQVSDTVKTVMAHVTDPTQLDAALAFAKSYDDIAKAADDAFSSVEDASKRTGPFTAALGQINTLFDQLTQQTEKFGLSIDPVNKALDEATKRLTVDFARAVDQAFNAATGQDYLNAIQAIVDNTNVMLADAKNVSATQDVIQKITDTYAAQLKTAFGALSGPQLDQVIAKFGDLTDALPELARTAKEAADATAELNKATAIYQIQQNYDVAAQQGFLAQLRDLDRQRIAAQAAAKDMGLDDTQRAIILETEHRAALSAMQGLTNDQLEQARAVLADLNPAFAAWVDEVKNATAATQAAADAQARSNAILAAGLQIRQYLNAQETGPDYTSPESRLGAARGQFATQLALAQAGDVTALQGITGIADQLRQALLGWFASSAQGQQEWADAKRALAALPGVPNAQQTATNQIVTAIVDTGTTTTTTITDTSTASTQQIVGTTVQTNAAIVDNARSTARDIISATGDSSTKIVNTAIATSDDIVRNAINGSAQITGATTTGLQLVTDATNTGAAGVIAATANTATAVNYTTGAVQGGTTALLASNEANAKTLIAGSKEDTQNLLAQQEANATALLGANAAQSAALIDQNGLNATAIVSTTNTTAANIVSGNTTSAQRLIDTAKAASDLARTTANDNTDNLIWSAGETSKEVASRNETAVHTVELATKTGTATLLAQAEDAASAHAQIAQTTTNQSIAAAYDTTATLAARTEAASAQVAATAEAGTTASIAAASANTNQLAARTDAASAQTVAAAQAGTTAQVSAAYETTAALGAQTVAASANVAATTQAGTNSLLQQGAEQLAAIQAMTGLTAGDQQTIGAIYNTSASVIQTIASYSNAIYGQIAAYATWAVQSSEAWSNAIVQNIAGWGNAIVQNIAAYVSWSVQSDAGWSNTIASTVGYWGTAIYQQIANYGEYAVASGGAWSSAVVSTVGAWGNAINATIATGTDTVARVTALWGNLLYTVVDRGTDTIWRTVDAWGNAVAGTVREWGNATVATIAGWEQAAINYQVQASNGIVQMLAQVSNSVTNSIFAAGDTQIAAVYGSSSNEIGATFANGNAIIGAIGSMSVNQIASTFAAANSIVGAVGIQTSDPVVSAIHDARDNIDAWVQAVYNRLGAMNDNDQYWDQTIYNMLAQIREQLIAVAAFSNEMRGARQYIQLLTEVSIDFFEYSARHDGIQQSQLDMVVDNLRRQAFG